MPILRKDGVALLFAHVPKTGGSSVEAGFREAEWRINFLDGKFGGGAINDFRRYSPQHAHAADLEATFRIDRFDAVFMYVRDPLKRMLSEYIWRHRKRETIDTAPEAFEAWLRETFKQALTNPCLHDNHIRPQHEFVVTGSRIYSFEDGLEAGLADLAELVGHEMPATLPKKFAASDVASVRSGDIGVNANAVRLIEDFYREDYRQFGYSTRES